MDDSLESPDSLSVHKQDEDGAQIGLEDEVALNQESEDEEDEGGEDGALDWTKLAGTARPSIPRRGEKEFEPRDGGTNLQMHILERSRGAMFDTLRSEWGISRYVSHPDFHSN